MASTARASASAARAPSSSQPKTETESVKVAVRVRPFNQREQASSQISVVKMSMARNTVYITPPTAANSTSHDGSHPNTAIFEFDHVFWSMSEPDMDGAAPADQGAVYNEIGKPLVAHAFGGFNSCLFAYGQTGSGKTHSMMGGADTTSEERGVIPRLAQDLFSEKKKLEDKTGSTWSVEFGFVEVYNEKVSDLLAPRKKDSKVLDVFVEVREDVKKGVFIQNQTLVKVHSFEDIMKMIDQGNNVRHVAATKMNNRSSRSHAIVMLMLNERRKIKMTTGQTVEAPGIVSRINLVDLAGSERVSASQVVGQQFEEAKFINLSLTTLGRVIDMLADMAKKPDSKWTKPPYRESKLTFLLKDSLGGNSKTFMIATVSPSDMNFDESTGTLRYASRAREIVNTAKINEDPQSRKIREMEEAMEAMRAKLGAQGGDPEYVNGLQEKLRQMEQETTQRAQELETLRLQKVQAEKQSQMLKATEEEKKKLQEEADELQRQVLQSQEATRQHHAELEKIKDEHLQREQEMREKLDSRENEINEMQRQLSEMRGTSETLSRTMGELDSEKKSKEEALKKLAAEQENLQKLLAQTADTDEQRKSLELQNKALLDQIKDKQEQQEQNDRLMNELAEIKNQQENQRAEMAQLQAKYERVLLDNDENDARQFLVQAAQGSYHDVFSDATNSFLAHIDLLEDRVEELRNDLEAITSARNSDLETQEELEKTIEQLKKDLDLSKATNAATTAELVTAKQSATFEAEKHQQEYNKLADDTTVKIDELQTQLQTMTNNIEDFTKQLEDEKSAHASEKEAHASEKSAHEATQKELSDLKDASTAAAGTAEGQIGDLNKQLEDEKSAHASEKSAHEATQKELSDLKDASTAAAGTAEGQIGDLNKQLEDEKSAHASEKSAHEATQNELADLKALTIESESHIGELSKELAGEKAAHEDSVAAKTRALSELADLKAFSEMSESQIGDLAMQLNEEKNAHESTQKELVELRFLKEEEYAGLKSKFSEVEDSAAATKAKMVQMDKKLRSVALQLQAADTRVKTNRKLIAEQRSIMANCPNCRLAKTVGDTAKRSYPRTEANRAKRAQAMIHEA